MRVLGIGAVFHGPPAAVAAGGKAAAAAEEGWFSRRNQGERPVPSPAAELPELAARRCPAQSGMGAGELDAIACSPGAALAWPAREGGDLGREALPPGR